MTTTAVQTEKPRPEITPDAPVRRLFTVSEFRRMAEAGVLDPKERVELIEGEILMMTPIGDDHHWLVILLGGAIREVLPANAIVAEQGGLEISEWSQFQPDITVVLNPPRTFRDPRKIPVASRVPLVVEVSDTTVRRDREIKLPLYARSGVPETWIVLVGEKAIEIHREPGPEGYAKCERVPWTTDIELAALPGVTVELSKLAGEPEEEKAKREKSGENVGEDIGEEAT